MMCSRNRLVGCLLAGVFLLSSCFKEKLKEPPSITHPVNTAVIEMGPDYSDQFFYSLSQNKVLSRNSRFAYDLMFDCRNNSFQVWLNSAKLMCAVRTGKTQLSAVTAADTVGKTWHYEHGAYDPDSSALGQWGGISFTAPVTFGEVYILSLGTDEADQPLGFVKLKFRNFRYNLNSYSIVYSLLNDTTEHEALIEKDNSRVYRYYSLLNHGVVDNIEPKKEDWDFCFTRYTHLFYDPYFLPYLVTGVLHNPLRIEAYQDSTVNYAEQNISTIHFERFRRQRDAVGYDWKKYYLGSYLTLQYKTYFIRQDEFTYYKLRFIDFNRNGVKGYPLFEFEQL